MIYYNTSMIESLQDVPVQLGNQKSRNLPNVVIDEFISITRMRNTYKVFQFNSTIFKRDVEKEREAEGVKENIIKEELKEEKKNEDEKEILLLERIRTQNKIDREIIKSRIFKEKVKSKIPSGHTNRECDTEYMNERNGKIMVNRVFPIYASKIKGLNNKTINLNLKLNFKFNFDLLHNNTNITNQTSQINQTNNQVVSITQRELPIKNNDKPNPILNMKSLNLNNLNKNLKNNLSNNLNNNLNKNESKRISLTQRSLISNAESCMGLINLKNKNKMNYKLPHIRSSSNYQIPNYFQIAKILNDEKFKPKSKITPLKITPPIATNTITMVNTSSSKNNASNFNIVNLMKMFNISKDIRLNKNKSTLLLPKK